MESIPHSMESILKKHGVHPPFHGKSMESIPHSENEATPAHQTRHVSKRRFHPRLEEGMFAMGMPSPMHEAVLGVKRMIQRPEERNDWQPGLCRTVQHHDDDEDVIIPHHNYFRAARFYCVETITTSCAVVIAWVKFDKSEFPTNILNLLEKIYPTKES